jgi:hypothetical protein
MHLRVYMQTDPGQAAYPERRYDDEQLALFF